MPKLKTHSGTKKRVRLTKTGKVMRRHATGNHFLEKKSEGRKRRFAGVESLAQGKQVKNIKRRLGV
ncbi:MAG TPA: 50S ribosomal protein L35 [Candidatus Saccharimonadales bacterium]|nr:50S ribosomal protein L35 [Candidatus Saccharimonadales bacterium]